MKMKKNLLLNIIVLLIFSSSCYEQSITIDNNNESGEIAYNININNDFEFFLSNINSKNKNTDKISVFYSRNIINKVTNNAFSLLKYDNSINGYYLNLNAVFSFKEFSNISDQLPSNYFPTRINTIGNTVIISTLLNLQDFIDKINLNLSEEDKKTVDYYSEIIKLKFIYNTPKQIITINNNSISGNLSNDKKQIIFETTLYEILNSKGDLEINFSYLK